MLQRKSLLTGGQVGSSAFAEMEKGSRFSQDRNRPRKGNTLEVHHVFTYFMLKALNLHNNLSFKDKKYRFIVYFSKAINQISRVSMFLIKSTFLQYMYALLK